MHKGNNTNFGFLRLTHYLEDGLLVAILATMIGLAVSQIFLRNFFGQGISWATPMLGILVLWVGLAGSIVASRKKNHISINVLSRYLSKKMALFADIVVELFTTVIAGIISYHSVNFVMAEYEDKMMAFDAVPAWICELIIPVAFAVIALRYLAHALENIKVLYALTKPKSSDT